MMNHHRELVTTIASTRNQHANEFNRLKSWAQQYLYGANVQASW
jgi:hypothetical protein